MPLKTVRFGVLTDEWGVPLDDGRGTHVFVWLPALTFCPVVPRKTENRERGGEERARVSYQSSHKVWEVSGYQPAVSFCRPHRTPVKHTDTHTSDFFSVLKMNLKGKKAWLHNRLMEWQFQKSSDLDAGCKYHLCLKDRQPFISNSLLSFFQNNMFFFLTGTTFNRDRWCKQQNLTVVWCFTDEVMRFLPALLAPPIMPS